MYVQKTRLIGIAILTMIVPVDRALGQISTRDDKAAIAAVSEARAEAFNQGDAEGIARHFTRDAVLMAPGKPASVGKKSVRAYYQSIFDAFEVQLDSYYEEVEVSGDMAYGRGEATVRLTPRNGGETTVTSSKYLNILARQPDGSWMTTHDIWNSNGVVP